VTIDLATLDPAAPLDDLEPLLEVVGDARVVAIGESAHWVREYQLLRHRLLRFLVERMGFTTLAMESGFSEGLAVDDWLHGDSGEDVDSLGARGFTYRMGRPPEMREQLRWMRANGTVSYCGLDLPGDLASMLPALDSLETYLTTVDPEANGLLAQARALAAKYAGPHTMPAFAAYGAMDPAGRDELTVALAELSARFDALRPTYQERGGRPRFATARHELRLAGLLDQALRAQLDGQFGVNVRDAAMAETVSWRLRQHDARIVIGAASTHIQRVPMPLGSGVRVPVMGAYLAADLGEDYLAIGVTCAGGHTPTRRAAPEEPGGVAVTVVELAPPVEGSVEAALAADGPRATDLRPLRGTTPAPDRTRVLDTYVEVPVFDAFDVMVCLPTIDAR
jgi:erythromycin esterase